MRKILNSYHSKNRDDRGAAMITVILTILIIMIMASSLLTMASMNYRMRLNNYKSKQNSYKTELALEKIRVDLRNEVQAAVQGSTDFKDGVMDLQRHVSAGAMLAVDAMQEFEDVSDDDFNRMETLQKLIRDDVVNTVLPSEDAGRKQLHFGSVKLRGAEVRAAGIFLSGRPLSAREAGVSGEWRDDRTDAGIRKQRSRQLRRVHIGEWVYEKRSARVLPVWRTVSP